MVEAMPLCTVPVAVVTLQLDGVPADSCYVFVSKDVPVSRRQEARFLAAEYLPVIEIKALAHPLASSQ